LSRLEDTLLAAMGEAFIQRHPWYFHADTQWFAPSARNKLAKIRDAGVTESGFIPGA
jgi:hypothetical protein